MGFTECYRFIDGDIDIDFYQLTSPGCKSHLTNRTVCSANTLVICHFGQFGTCSNVSNFDPLIQVFFYCDEGMKMFVITRVQRMEKSIAKFH